MRDMSRIKRQKALAPEKKVILLPVELLGMLGAVTLEDLKRVGALYLDPSRASVAVITSAPGAEALTKEPQLQGCTLRTL